MAAEAPDAAAVATQDHPFEPRTDHVRVSEHVLLPPNPALCRHCRLAEAAHLSVPTNERPPEREGGTTQTAVE